MEQLKELCKWYQIKSWTKRLFFKALLTKGLAWKEKNVKVENSQSKNWNDHGGKVGKPIIFCKYKKPRCFKGANAASKFGQVSHFADAKTWMQINIMEKVLQKLNKTMKLENRNILLFLDNALVHPESLVAKYSNAAKKWSIEKSYYVMYFQGFQTTIMHLILLKKSSYGQAKLSYGQQTLGKTY